MSEASTPGTEGKEAHGPSQVPGSEGGLLGRWSLFPALGPLWL